MSILDNHLTDAEVSKIGQGSLDEILQKLGIGRSLPVAATTFFLNPNLLSCSTDPVSMDKAILGKLSGILPHSLLSNPPPDFAMTFRGLGDLAFTREGNFCIVLSRPNNASSLSDRVAERTNIGNGDLDISAGEKVCGFDNLELINRLYQIFNSFPNGGVERLKQLGQFKLIQYRSMLGAKRTFMVQGGDARTIGLHEATAHVGVFTKSKLSSEYTGFMGDFGLDEVAVEFAYRKIFDQLVSAGYASKHQTAKGTLYNAIPFDNLIAGINDLLDRYEGQISKTNGKNLTAFNAVASVGASSEAESVLLRKLSPEQLLETAEHFIAFQTAKGLKALMGKNILKFSPERQSGAFNRISMLMHKRYS